MNWEEELAKVRASVQAEVFKHEECVPYTPADGGILGKIQHFNPDSPVLPLALGPLGSKLCAFSKAIDRSHPDLSDLMGGAMGPGHEFCETAEQLLRVANFCHADGLMRIAPHFAKMATKLPGYDDLVQQIDNPALILNHLRFVPSQADRDELRSKQRYQQVKLHQVSQQGPVVWDPLPTSFASYVRNINPYGDDIERCKKKASFFVDNGCPELASKITTRIQSFEDQTKDRYYGFNRITIVTASVIFAKMMNFTLVNNGSNGKYYRISFSEEFLQSVRDKAGQNISSVGSGDSQGVAYEPRLYLAMQFNETMPESTKLLINHLEAFPATGGRPIFDHFWVLVPSINFATLSTADVVNTKILTEGTFKFDEKLVQTKTVMPVLLGEKEGKMYFLDYMS